MELINATRMVTGYNMALDPSGRESLVVVIKGTFRLPLPGEPDGAFALHDEQVPLVMADSFTGEPGLSAPLYEVDFAPVKPRCDILLQGTAHAPGGRPTSSFDVGIRVGPWHKALTVIGPRQWDCGIATLQATPATPITSQAIGYQVAFGGVDLNHDDPLKHAAFLPNPVGRGFHRHLRKEWVDGRPLPSTEELGRRVTEPDADYRPMAFGPLGRGWAPRAALAGTYDNAWREHHFPFLPPDFHPAYFQSAPTDQQVPLDSFRRGPVEVMMSNLTPAGATRFTIPFLDAPVHFFPRQGPREDVTAVLDTVMIEPDLGRFTLTWRVARPLRRNLFEIGQVMVGKKGREWWQQRATVTFPIPVVMVPMASDAGAPGRESQR